MRTGLKVQPGEAGDPAPQYPFLVGFFTVQFAVLIFLQKFAIPLGGLFEISFTLVALYAGLAFMMLFSRFEVSPLRLIAYTIFALSAIVSQIQLPIPYSAPSMMMFLLLYFPLVFMWRVEPEVYEKLLRPFQNFMLVGAIAVFLQLLVNVGSHYRFTLNIEPFIPKPLFLHGYLYEAPLHYGMLLKRPNGFFFLEPSWASAYLTCAFIIETVHFKRFWRILIYAFALLGTMAATGQVMLAVALPILLTKLSGRTLILGGIAALLFGAVAASTGMLDLLLYRTGEIGASGTSGSVRVSQPFFQLLDTLRQPDVLWHGAGAGNSVQGMVSSPWPFVKTTIEYGMLTSIAYMTFLIICMWNTPNKALFVAIFVMFNFIGGYSMLPAAVNLIALLCCMPSRLQPAKALLSPRLRSASRAAGSMARRTGSPFEPTGDETAAAETIEHDKIATRSI